MLEQMSGEVEKLLWQQNDKTDRFLTILKEDWPSGLVGLVAGKIAEKYFRPTIVGSLSGKSITASGRTNAKYHLLDGLTSHKQYLDRYGGHRQAAGMSLSAENWEAFTSAIKADAQKKIDESLLQPVYEADAILDDGEITINLARELEQLQPHGIGNSKPAFILPNITIRQVRPLGDGSHHRLSLSKGEVSFDGIWFRSNGRVAKLADHQTNLLGHLEVNRFRGNENLQFQVVDQSDDSSTIESVDEIKD